MHLLGEYHIKSIFL